MAKNNNKGFSLIEVVIAVAILSLLLSPILLQIAQTLKTSAAAKEKQYVVENAEYVLEYFQDTPSYLIGNDGLLNISEIAGTESDNLYDCEAVDEDGISLNTVEFTCKNYAVDNVQLGKEQNTYSRTVVMDDLSNKLLEKSLVTKDKSDLSDVQLEKFITDGYEVTSEGTIVKYNVDATGFKYVECVVCDTDASKSGYKDPNTVNLGFIQDLDANKVAIIQGTAANFDAQAESEFYSLKMKNLKEDDYAAWEQAMEHVTGDNMFATSSFAETVAKTTKISITSGTKNGKTCYLVTVDVYYQSKYNIYSHSITDKLSYNVYSKEFYTNTSPDVYFIYEPFTDTTTATSVIYTSSDHIVVYNDKECNDSKVYLIKPDATQFDVKTTLAASYRDDTFYTRISGRYQPVRITVNHLGLASGEAKPLKVYTNVNIDEFDGALDSSITDIDAPATTTRKEYNKAADIRPISEDTRVDGRLYTVTVSLTKLDETGAATDNVTTFTGARGAN